MMDSSRDVIGSDATGPNTVDGHAVCPRSEIASIRATSTATRPVMPALPLPQRRQHLAACRRQAALRR